MNNERITKQKRERQQLNRIEMNYSQPIAQVEWLDYREKIKSLSYLSCRKSYMKNKRRV